MDRNAKITGSCPDHALATKQTSFESLYKYGIVSTVTLLVQSVR
jgi:hypothetical protein